MAGGRTGATRRGTFRWIGCTCRQRRTPDQQSSNMRGDFQNPDCRGHFCPSKIIHCTAAQLCHMATSADKEKLSAASFTRSSICSWLSQFSTSRSLLMISHTIAPVAVSISRYIYIYTYIHTYIHTITHTYIFIYIYLSLSPSLSLSVRLCLQAQCLRKSWLLKSWSTCFSLSSAEYAWDSAR